MGYGMEWNHTVPRTPSRIGPDMVVMMPGDKTVADEAEDAFLRLRQMSSRPPIRRDESIDVVVDQEVKEESGRGLIDL